MQVQHHIQPAAIHMVASEVTSRAKGMTTGKLGRYTNNAEHLGLDPIGESSYCALAVGVHPELPDVVIKVVSIKSDGFYLYAKAILEGELRGEHFPVILSVTKADDHNAVIMMERLDEIDECMRSTLIDDLRAIVYDGRRCGSERPDPEFQHLADFGRWISYNGYSVDMHYGNFMVRNSDNGPTVVFIDPLGPNSNPEMRGRCDVSESPKRNLRVRPDFARRPVRDHDFHPLDNPTEHIRHARAMRRHAAEWWWPVTSCGLQEQRLRLAQIPPPRCVPEPAQSPLWSA